jgi:hypothetical protein
MIQHAELCNVAFKQKIPRAAATLPGGTILEVEKPIAGPMGGWTDCLEKTGKE